MSQTTSKYDEASLVELLKTKDQQIFSYLYDNYSAVLYGIVMKTVVDKDVANDILQEVFIKIWRNIDSYDPSRGRLYTWMINITRNASIDYLRSKQFQNDAKNQNIEDSVNSINRIQSAEQQTDTIGLGRIVNQLPAEQKKVIDLVYFKGFTQDETSVELNIPLGTVKTRIRAAIKSLRSVFIE